MYREFILKTKDINLSGYHWISEDPKAVICLLHGIGEYAGRYDKIGEFFKESHFSLIAIDLRGHGKSEGKRGHAAPRKKVFDDIDAMLEFAGRTAPNVPLYLYGHSMGGNIGLDYRSNGPKRDMLHGYIITAPWLKLYKKIPEPMVILARILSKIKPDYLMDTGLSPKDLAHVQSEVTAYTNDPMVHKKISVLTAINGLDAAARILSKPSNCHRPLLLMHGTEDKICAIEGSRIVKNLENDHCTYIEWPGYYHEIHNEKDGGKVLIAIRNWIYEKD